MISILGFIQSCEWDSEMKIPILAQENQLCFPQKQFRCKPACTDEYLMSFWPFIEWVSISEIVIMKKTPTIQGSTYYTVNIQESHLWNNV